MPDDDEAMALAAKLSDSDEQLDESEEESNNESDNDSGDSGESDESGDSDDSDDSDDSGESDEPKRKEEPKPKRPKRPEPAAHFLSKDGKEKIARAMVDIGCALNMVTKATDALAAGRCDDFADLLSMSLKAASHRLEAAKDVSAASARPLLEASSSAIDMIELLKNNHGKQQMDSLEKLQQTALQSWQEQCSLFEKLAATLR